jgi:hypothetical protein
VPWIAAWACKEEIPVPSFGNATVDDGAVLRVRGTVGVFFLGYVKPGMVAFADDDIDMRGNPFLVSPAG